MANIEQNTTEGVIIPRDQHNISRKLISDNALKVLYHLKKSGFKAYLVGGCVRDLLLGHQPKDFDVATDAHPEQVKEAFSNCRLIGRRFRLAHVYFHREIIEVATFRAGNDEIDQNQLHMQKGKIIHDNDYGNIQSDALRRDFSLNALYYNIEDFSIADFTQGMRDVNHKMIKIIGDPEQRFREDPVRMLRAIRFKSKLGFKIEKKTKKQIKLLSNLVEQVPSARLFDELIKLFHHGNATKTFELLKKYNLLGFLFPSLVHVKHSQIKKLQAKLFKDTDARIRAGKTTSVAFLLSALLWYPIMEKIPKDDRGKFVEVDKAINEILREQVKATAIPKRLTSSMKEIWHVQLQLKRRQPRRVLEILEHPRFRAAYDLLLIRNASGEKLSAVCKWWGEFQFAKSAHKQQMIQKLKR